MAEEINISNFNINIGEETIQDVIKNLQEIASIASAEETKNNLDSQLSTFFTKAERYYQLLNNNKDIESAQNKFRNDKEHILSQRGKILTDTRNLIRLQNLYLEIYGFLQLFREFITGRKMKYIIGIQEKENVTVGEYTFLELLQAQTESDLFSLGLTKNFVFSIRLGIKNLDAVQKLMQKNIEQNQNNNGWRQKIIDKYKAQKNKKGGIVFEAAASAVAASTSEVIYKGGNISAFRRGDLTEEEMLALTNEKNIEGSVKLLQLAEETRGASLITATTLMNALHIIITIKQKSSQYSGQELKEWLKISLFEAESNYKRNLIDKLDKALEENTKEAFKEYMLPKKVKK